MNDTWIKLFRKSIDSRVFKNEGLWKVWTWCLMRANHKNGWVTLKTGKGTIEVECREGQFIFGRNSAAKELNMDPSTVWKRINKLKNLENLTIESNRQYSLISIVNWASYQQDRKKSNKQGNKQVTSKEQASNTNKNVKNVKNVKKIKKKNIYGEFKNIFLTDSEYEKLAKKYNSSCDQMIERMSQHIETKTKDPYKSHYAAILKNEDWLIKRDKLMRTSHGKNRSSYTGISKQDYEEGVF